MLLEQINKAEKRMNEIKAEVDSIKPTDDGALDKIKNLTEEYRSLSKERAELRAALDITPVEITTSAPMTIVQAAGEERNEDARGTIEYRTAFMKFIKTGKVSDALKIGESRADATTLTSDISYAIPSTIQNKVITELISYGGIYAKITKSNIKGGVSVPIGSFDITATWVGDGQTSETKKVSTSGSVSFNYYLLEARVGTSLIASVTQLDVFESIMVERLVAAVVIAIEKAVFLGTGVNQPIGILTDVRVPASNKLTVALADLTFDKWQSNRNKLKTPYRKNPKNAFYCAQDTFDKYMFGLKDNNGQPIARVTSGIDGEPNYRFLGREVVIVEDDVLPSFDDAAASAPFLVYGNLEQWVLNSNMAMTYDKVRDKLKNRIVDMVQTIADGKLLDANAVLIFKKPAA